MQDVQTTLPTGSVVQDRYKIERLLGKGGFGAVYLVSDQRVRGNLFALKELIDPSKKERDRFTFEGEVLKRLDHPSLPRVYRTFEDEKNYRAYILMDYIDGSNLEVLRQQQPEKRFPVAQAMQMMAPIIGAVGYLHQQHPPIIHRDIKPANIIQPDDGGETVLVDFGIAKEYDMEGTTTAIRRCSPGYGAPEQYAMGTNLQTDVYGLGATLYALLTGHVPTDALYRVTQMGSKHSDPLEPVTQLAPDVPKPISDVIMQAMAVNTNERFATVEAFWQALTQEQEGAAPLAQVNEPVPAPAPQEEEAVAPTVAAMPTVVVSRLPGSGGRRPLFALVFAIIAVLALLTGLLFGFGLLGRGGHPVASSTTRTTPVVHQATATHPATPQTSQAGGAAPAAAATPAATPTRAAVATPSPTAVPTTGAATVTATPQPGATAGGSGGTSGSTSYPRLQPLYTGTINDRATSPTTTASMQLSQIQQNGANIKGHLTLGPGLLASDTFTGTVSSDNKIQFTVPGYSGLAPLLFQGQIASDGSMSGTYCSYSGDRQCDKSAGGWGDWKVSPSS